MLNTKTPEQIAAENLAWHEHKERSDKLWNAYMACLPGTPEREQAKDAYLVESSSYWDLPVEKSKGK